MNAVGLKNRWHVQCHVLSFPDTALLRRLRHMTVGAADFALRDLFEDRVPLEAVQRHVRDVRALVPKMIAERPDRAPHSRHMDGPPGTATYGADFRLNADLATS